MFEIPNPQLPCNSLGGSIGRKSHKKYVKMKYFKIRKKWNT